MHKMPQNMNNRHKTLISFPQKKNKKFRLPFRKPQLPVKIMLNTLKSLLDLPKYVFHHILQKKFYASKNSK